MRHGDTHHRAVVLAAGHLGLAARGRVALRGTVGVSASPGSLPPLTRTSATVVSALNEAEPSLRRAEGGRGGTPSSLVTSTTAPPSATSQREVQSESSTLEASLQPVVASRTWEGEDQRRRRRGAGRGGRRASARTTKLSMTSPLSTSVATLALTTSTPQARMCSERSARRPGRSLAVTVTCCSPAGDSCTTTPVSRSSSLTDSIPVERQQRGQKKEGIESSAVLRRNVRRLSALCLVSSGSRCVSQH